MFRLAGLLLALAASYHAAEGAQQPHIMLIVSDDLGFNDVGFHGSEIESAWISLTPNRLHLSCRGLS